MSEATDRLVAEHVMGIDLRPPRGRALVAVGAQLTSVTGNPWKLTNGKMLTVPDGKDLPQPEGTTDWNARYLAYVAEHSGEDVEALVNAIRDRPDPYSTEIASAFEALESLDCKKWWPEVGRVEDGTWYCEICSAGPLGSIGPPIRIVAPTAPMAICLALLQVAGKEGIA